MWETEVIQAVFCQFVSCSGSLDAEGVGGIFSVIDRTPNKHCSKKEEAWQYRHMPAAQEAEVVEGLQVQGQPGLCSKTLLRTLEEETVHSFKEQCVVGNPFLSTHQLLSSFIPHAPSPPPNSQFLDFADPGWLFPFTADTNCPQAASSVPGVSLYLRCQLQAPHYSAQISVTVTLLRLSTWLQ